MDDREMKMRGDSIWTDGSRLDDGEGSGDSGGVVGGRAHATRS